MYKVIFDIKMTKASAPLSAGWTPFFIWLLKTWSSGPGQRVMALPEESLEEFEVN